MNEVQTDEITAMIWEQIRVNTKVCKEFVRIAQKEWNYLTGPAHLYYYPNEASMTREVVEDVADAIKLWFYENSPSCNEWWNSLHGQLLNEMALRCDWLWIAGELVAGVKEGVLESKE